ncbi:related to TGF beta receptor associated protein-1 [Melanopsichium pennsylvanicum]|uniref:Related to TGF beta receptor associated protein-1 n=2 Tax=Melanopsichium pennsylvanicum TaxID=63383 RepID=A0AAJ4XJL8_9BASI|nr:related to TGF beta receptor associated protein-1 [Melanopsichium pennsylvanicum 4]SNX83217.1 related to TGF beta receptor associated protein-1 [Melanopsichium pennsylvanicum]
MASARSDSCSQEPVPPYALAPLLFPALPIDEFVGSPNPESPAAIQQNSQRSIRCSESDGCYLYIGTSDGLIHSFQVGVRTLNASSSSIFASQTPEYSLRGSRLISNNAKPVEKIVLFRSFNAAAVLCEGVVSFFSLPDWSPIPSLPSIRAVSTIVLDDAETQYGTGTDGAGMISICIVRRKNIILGKIGAERRSDLFWTTVKDIPLPGGAIFARRFADTLCIANATEYSLVNLSSGKITQLQLPISQTGESPSAQVRPSIVTVPVHASHNREGDVSPAADRSGFHSAPAKCEFLVTSHSDSITLGVFVKPSGEPAPKLLEWPSHPRSVTFDGQHLVSLLRNDTVEIHDLGQDSVDKVQTLQLPPGLDPRFLQPVQDPTPSAHRIMTDGAEGKATSNDALDIVKVSLSRLDSSNYTVLRRTREFTSTSSSLRSQILLCGRNSTSAVQQDPLVDWTTQQLHRGRLRNLRQNLNSYRSSRAFHSEGDDAGQTPLESSVAHALLGVELLHRADFSAAGDALRHANIDPRFFVALFPTLSRGGSNYQEAILPLAVLSSLEKLKHREEDRLQSVDELVTSNLTLNYSPPLDVTTDKTLGQLRSNLLHRADVMLRSLLQAWRIDSTSAAGKNEARLSFWAGALMDEQMLINVNACVDSAYLHVIAQRRGIYDQGEFTVEDELKSFLASKHACAPSLVEAVLQDKHFLSLLAEHHERNGNVEAALKIWSGLIDGKMSDALHPTIDASKALSKVTDLLLDQSDQNLLSSYGRWLVTKDPEAGIRILTKQTATHTADTSKKSTPRSKAQELEAVQAHKATINELRDIDADTATRYLEVVALSTTKVQDEQMHRELAAALLGRIRDHLKLKDYRQRMQIVAREYAQGSYAESFFAHLALASNGSSADVDRLKLGMLLQGSTVLDYESLLDTINPLETLVYEKAIILGRLGRDAEALSLLAVHLRDANSAEAYCSQDGEVLSPMLATSIAEDHEALRPFAAMLSRTYTQRIKAHAKATAHRELSGVQRKEELLKQLLSVYMANGAEAKFRIATAHLLNTQALHLDNRQVLDLMPKDWPLQTLETFLTQSLRRQLHRKREAQILREVAKGRNLDVAEDLWARQRAMGGILQDTDLDVDGAGGGDVPVDATSFEDWKEGDATNLAEKTQQQRSSHATQEDATFGKEARIDLNVLAGYEIPQSAAVHAEVDDVGDLG